MNYLKFTIPVNKPDDIPIGFVEKYFFRMLGYMLSKVIPKANPEFEQFFDEVQLWLLECEVGTGIPLREIGLDKKGIVILKMPFRKEYGYWTDNNLLFDDFKTSFNAVAIEQDEFEMKWNELV